MVCVQLWERTDLLEAGDGIHELDVQLGVVLGQRFVPVVADEIHHWVEGQRLWETVLPIPVVDLDQLIVASFPEGRKEKKGVHLPASILRPLPVELSRNAVRTTVVLRVLPQCECVVALHLRGSIPHQEGPVRHVSEFIIHFLPVGQTYNSWGGLHRWGSRWKRKTYHNRQVSYLEMSPQYHSASCNAPPSLVVVLPPPTPTDEDCWDFAGFGGRAAEKTEVFFSAVLTLHHFSFTCLPPQSCSMSC